jgi:hypothetical protein
MRNDHSEIENYIEASNRFFQGTGHTLSDLHFYADPLAAVVNAVLMASEGFFTEEQALEAMKKAISDYKALNAVLGLANAA